jgi:hypothetical protein
VFWTQKTRPRARDEGLLIEHVNDETVVFDTETREAHCLSPLAAVVFAHSNGRTSPEGLAAFATERLGQPVDVDGVEEALAQLDERKLLEPSPGITRRHMIGKSAAVGGLVLTAPLITSVVPPASAAASSATCGGPFPLPTVLCCPCQTCSGANKDECCQPPFTNKCQCVKAESNASKFCKPSAQSAQGDAVCGDPTSPDFAFCFECRCNQSPTTANCPEGCGALTQGVSCCGDPNLSCTTTTVPAGC